MLYSSGSGITLGEMVAMIVEIRVVISAQFRSLPATSSTGPHYPGLHRVVLTPIAIILMGPENRVLETDPLSTSV